MAPGIIGDQPRARPIVITPSMFSGDESRKILDGMELPKYAVGLFESNGQGPRKRKRLTHLTPDEKIMRRKFKNRVAAQTARDRKKARIEILEESVSKIHEQTKKLLDVNYQLIERTEALERENEMLRQRLGLETDGTCSKQEKKAKLSSIKKEFNQIISFQNMVAKDRMNDESSDDDSCCILTSCEGDSVTIDKRSCTDFSPLTASKCVSPVPAAFGERIKEGPIPQQQEAVNSAKLIHLQAKGRETSTQPLTQMETLNPRKMTRISQISSELWKQSIHRNTLSLTLPVKREMPLDLRKH